MKKMIPAGTSLIVLIGPSGSGKSTFATKNFPSNEIVSSDAIREEFLGDTRRQDKNELVFKEFHRRINAKLEVGQRVVADATNIKNADRKKVASIGHERGVPVIYVVINRSVESKLQTGEWRTEVFHKGVGLIERHEQTFVANENAILSGDRLPPSSSARKPTLATEVIDTRVDEYRIAQQLPREPINADQLFLAEQGYRVGRIIGDVHGNFKGLEKALHSAPDKTFFFFLGDIVDYGSDSLMCASAVSNLVMDGRAACVRGNHERKIHNFVTQERGDGFRGRVSHGNEATVNRLKALSPRERLLWEEQFLALVNLSPDWIEFGDWLLVHGAAHPKMWGNTIFRAPKNSVLESYALYGETTGDYEGGYPVRKYDWIEHIPPRKSVVVGHAVRSVDEPLCHGRAVFLDTGSSKDLDGVPGKLSWMDIDIISTNFVRFGSE